MKETPFMIAFIGVCFAFAIPVSIILFVWTLNLIYIKILITALIGFMGVKWVDEFIEYRNK